MISRRDFMKYSGVAIAASMVSGEQTSLGMTREEKKAKIRKYMAAAKKDHGCGGFLRRSYERIGEVWQKYSEGALTNRDLVDYYVCRSNIYHNLAFLEMDDRKRERLLGKAGASFVIIKKAGLFESAQKELTNSL